jgi:hypothetical protein
MQKYLFYFNFSRNKGKLYLDVLLWKQYCLRCQNFGRLVYQYDMMVWAVNECLQSKYFLKTMNFVCISR